MSVAQQIESYASGVHDLLGEESTREETYYPAVKSLIDSVLRELRLPVEVRQNTQQRRQGGGFDLPDLALYDAQGEFLSVCVEVIVIGGGQAGLAVGYYLRRTGLSLAILDDREAPGGAWTSTWKSLRLFSPAEHSSLPGWPMPRAQRARYGSASETPAYPSRKDTISYLKRYEERYDLPVKRPVRVEAVRREGTEYVMETASGKAWRATAVVSATGTASAPHMPSYPGQDAFRGEQLHSSAYRSPTGLMGQRVVVVGGGNSGAQIMAEVSRVAEAAAWATRTEPTFLPPEVDGRVLFGEATARYKAQKEGRRPERAYSLGDIVQVKSVRQAKLEGRLRRRPMFERFTPEGVVWPSGKKEQVDAVIWATGFSAALGHLRPLSVTSEDGHIDMQGTRVTKEPCLWLVGYGNWTGFASATLIGVGRTARRTASEITDALKSVPHGAA